MVHHKENRDKTGGSSIVTTLCRAAVAAFVLVCLLSAGAAATQNQEPLLLVNELIASNEGAPLPVVAALEFSHHRGFYEGPFAVTITTETPDAAIVYTLDGSTPTPGHGAVYTGPIPIARTTCLRATAIKSDWKSTNVATHTYIFPNDVMAQATDPATGAQVTPAGYPVLWDDGRGDVVTGDYQVDPDVVNHATPANRLDASDLKSVPTISLVTNRDDLFGDAGIYLKENLTYRVSEAPEKVGSFEYIDPGADQSVQANCALAMSGGVTGGGTSLQRWKSFKLSMRPRFKTQTDDGTPTGGPSKLNFKLFTDSPIERFDTVVLDAVLNHSWLHQDSGQRSSATYIQDQYVADLHNALGGHSPHGSYAHVYINGLYWGVYYIHERPDHAWAAQMFGGDADEYHAIKHNAGGVIHNGAGGSATSSYNAMLSAANAVGSNPTDPARYDVLREQLDVDDFITYLLANWFCGNHDWPDKNWYATCRNGAGGKWRFHSWDAEHTLEGTDSVGRSPSSLHDKLAQNAEYRLRFADLAHRAFFNEGPLSYPQTAERFKARMNQIDRAIVGESARWGDNRRSQPYTRQDWLNTQNARLASFFPGRSDQILGQLRSHGLYPHVEAPAFRVNGLVQHGGHITSTDTLSIIAPGGTVWYTLDGSDPRVPGAGPNANFPDNVSPAAIRYSNPMTLGGSVHMKARAFSGSTWSALNKATFAVGPVVESLRITEIMYHPIDTGHLTDPNAEYIELTNIGSETIDLNLVTFTDGVDFTFPSLDLTPREHLLVVKDVGAFEVRYGSGFRIAGQYAGSLSNGGERIVLSDALGQAIADFRYEDDWYDLTDGLGFSLTVKDPARVDSNALSDKDSWRISTDAGGSPGFDDADGQAGLMDH
jgi:hypothetical protein